MPRNPLFDIADRLATGGRRSAEFSRQVQARVGLMQQQAGINEQSAQANHGRHLELLGALQNHELSMMHAGHTHEYKMSAQNAKADVMRIGATGAANADLARTNWEGANNMATTIGSYAPEKAREAFNPMDPPAQPSAPSVASPTAEAPAEDRPKRASRAKKSAEPQGTLF
jgi:hypothetical protein